jgi:thiol-disulfide isomerase/thioredoxin
VLYTAAQSLGHMDSMRIAIDSTMVYQPTDPGGLFTLAFDLRNAGQHLDWAERAAARAIKLGGLTWSRSQDFDDYRSLAYIQIQRAEYPAAMATLERLVASRGTADSWTALTLGELYARNGRPALAVEQLERGLSVFPRDSAQAGQSIQMLDSLLAADGRERAPVHARIAQAVARSKHGYYLDGYRDGHRAPETRLLDLASGRRSSPAAAPGITVLSFWATWCGPCRHHLPQLQKWAAHPRTRPVRLVTINADGGPFTEAVASARAFVAERALTLPVLVADSVQTLRWGVRGFPAMLVLRDGRIEFRGNAGDEDTGLEAELVSLGSARKPER